jgi:predicted aconitase with swiveling domain
MIGRSLVAGQARAELLVAREPLSFWGGYDQASGEIIDRRHPLAGQMAADKVLALPGSRGSSTTTAVLLEALRAGRAPAAILVTNADTFFALASVVADEMYGRSIPIVQLSEEDFETLKSGEWVRIDEDGTVVLEGSSR